MNFKIFASKIRGQFAPVYRGQFNRYLHEGLLVKIEKFGQNYQGVKLNLLGTEKAYGWNIGDITWENITLIEKNKYKAIVIIKGFQNGEPNITKADIFLTLSNKDTLLVRNYDTDKSLIGEGKERRYKRIK